MKIVTPEEGAALIGSDLGASEWKLVDQELVTAFAELTGDRQHIHVDPVAAAAGPFGGTIAHGFLTLSLLGSLVPPDVLVLENATMGVNYGFDKLRFLSPVRTGSRVRVRHRLRAIEDKGDGRYLTTTEVTVEIEGSDKPALVAEWLGLQHTSPADAVRNAR